MIQRIQTLYFLLSAIIAVVTACLPLGRWVSESGRVVAKMGAFSITNGDIWHFAPFGVLLILAALLSIVSIVIYHHRMYQARLAVLNIMILFGGYAVYAIYSFAMAPESSSFRLGWGAALPFVGGWLQWLAWKAVMRDEMLVRSLDRLR